MGGRKSEWETTYDIFLAVSSSFQGLIVSALLCFFNKEVQGALSRRWQQSSSLQLTVLPLAELVHLPLVAATSITTSIANPKPRMASRNNSIDPPGNVPNWNHLESLPREPNILTEEHSILLNQMIRRNNGDENQKTLETLIRSSLVTGEVCQGEPW